MQKLRSFLLDDSGASAIEYAMVAGLVSAVAIGSFVFTGGKVEDLWNKVVAASLYLQRF